MKVLNDIKANFGVITWYTIMLILCNITLSWIPSFFINQVNYNQGETSFSSSVLLISGIFAPFFEETFMRGIFQNWLEKNITIPLWGIYGIVAIVFSALHMQFYFVPFFITSILLSYVYDRSEKKLVVPFFIHSLYNIFVIVISNIFSH
ncbi:CPBP family intramembrane metalloprotease [Enterococcus faecium]|nr:CPBP family intramembrane metalloprotease [Enterococcus faecium]